MTHPEIDSAPADSPFTVTLFGPMHVTVEGSPLPPLRSRKALWLLALLALRHKRPVERAWLAGMLWPDLSQDQAFNNMRPVLSELRKALGNQSSRLQSHSRHLLSLDLTGAEVDVLRFDRAIASPKPSDLEEAIALYSGPLLEGCTEEWVLQERGVREQGCLRALQHLADTALASTQYDVAAAYYRQALSIAPLWDAARRGLMTALDSSGDRNAAMHVYREFYEMLRRDPQAVPDQETSALYTRLRSKAERPTAPNPQSPLLNKHVTATPVVTGYLPHTLTALIGRKDECRELAEHLRHNRLLTLTGTGGIGKTRLAIAIASDSAPEFTDGAWWVALESLSEAAQVTKQIATVLGVKEEVDQPPLECLTDYLRGKQALLVLDNCEHLLEPSAQIADHLLRECEGIRLLATSREALGITGETAWRVPSLETPKPHHLMSAFGPNQHVLASYDSVQLFVERAQAIQRDFQLTAENSGAVAEICSHLEGIPLAIELAAARIRSLTVKQIVARLDDHLALLTGGSRTALSRQQTLRAALDWSYNMLSEPERLLLARMSVFAGGWALEAAEQIGSGDSIETKHVLELLTSLIDKSLVVFNGQVDSGRYRMLETVRQYGAERLIHAGETETVKTKHRDHFLAIAEASIVTGAEREETLRRLETEHDNLRAALSWCNEASEGAGAGLRLASALWPFWFMTGHLREGRAHLLQVLGREGDQEPSPARARALRGAGAMSTHLGDYKSARLLLEDSLQIQRQLGNKVGIVAALNGLSNVYADLGYDEKAAALCRESLDIARDVGELPHIAWTLHCLGNATLALNDYPAARRFFQESLTIRRGLKENQSIVLSLLGLSAVMIKQGDYEETRVVLDESLSLSDELNDKFGKAWSLYRLGRLFSAQGDMASSLSSYTQGMTLFRELALLRGIEGSLGDIADVMLALDAPEKAVQLWGAVEALQETIGKTVLTQDQSNEQQFQSARSVLGEQQFTAAWETGRSMSWMQAVDYALNAICPD